MKKNIKKRKKWLIPVCIVVILTIVSGIIRYNNNKPVKKENPYNVFVKQYSEVYEPPSTPIYSIFNHSALNMFCFVILARNLFYH